MVGWRDVPADLSDTAQIERVRAALPPHALMLSSDLSRAADTARVLCSTQTLRPANADLREFNFGAWDGLHFSQVAARDPDLSRRFWENPGALKAPDGESWDDVAARVRRVVDKVNAAHPDGDIIAVAHFGVILTQVQRALGVTPYEALSHRIDPLSLSVLEFDGRLWRADRINHHP